MTPEELDHIEQRAEKATKGPWDADTFAVYAAGDRYDCVIHTGSGRSHPDQNIANALFAAAARTDIPKLVAEVKRLRGLLEESERLHKLAGAEDVENAEAMEQMLARITELEAENKRLRVACEAVNHAINNTDLNGCVIWIQPPYQAPAIHESASDRLRNVLELSDD